MIAVEIRRARPEDRPAILAISAQIWGGEDYVPHVLDGWLLDEGFVVAELDGQVTGFAKMTLLSPGEVWLEGLRVDPAQRGRGVAKSLARHQLDAALTLKPRSIRFATAEENVESLHIAGKQGFREVARFTYVEGSVQDQTTLPEVVPICDVAQAWEFVRASPAHGDAHGLLALGWRFPELTMARFADLVAAGAAFACGDPVRGVLVQAPDPYAADLYAAIAFLDGDDEAWDALLRFAHAKAHSNGQTTLAAMVPGEERVETFARHGLAPVPYFRYVLVLEYPLP